MRVVETQSAMLANHEVYSHIKAVHANNFSKTEYNDKKTVVTSDGRTVVEHSGKLRALNHVITETIGYFEESHGYLGDKNRMKQGLDNNAPTPTYKLLQDLKPYRLTKTELLMLLNLRPEAIDQLEPLVEEVSERFTQGEQLEIVRIICNALSARNKLIDT